MWQYIKEFLMQFLKSFWQDCIADIFWYGIGIIVILLGALTVSIIDDEKIALRVVGVIVLVVYTLAFRYKPKDK
ncbi:hypothetical protein ACKU08_013435 [Enterobacter cloacae]|uniref:hypothetical protein n=1 Tax=Enterobacter cloacae TaxID=550 RepID=UPI001A2E7576|nr:hypothetical protein [Enterobacter cloacae]EGQ7341497.1 hypothetical protein [Enterobacter cloacae]